MVFYNDAVTVYRPARKTNRAQESVLDYAGLRAAIAAETAPGVDRSDVQVRPISQSEVNDESAATQISGWAIATRPGTGDWDIEPTDWILLPTGELVELVGEPARPSDPFGGGVHHVEVRTQRAVG